MSHTIRVPRVVVAAPTSGQGKTTVAAAVMRLLHERGLDVAPFKAGPDYIDPTHHTAAAGRASRNLDGWLLPHDTLRALFHRATTGRNRADVAVIEGMMGLFDGHGGATDAGSTAEVARLLGAPVVAVLDASAVARTAAALVHGLHTFDPALPLAGVVLNRVAGDAHFRMLREAIEPVGVPVLGWLPDDPALAVPERHLGLVLAGERTVDAERLAAAAAATLDLDRLLEVARSAPPLALPDDALATGPGGARAVLAVARDEAFAFHYEDNLDLLRGFGAEVRYFSPLHDEGLPPDTGAVYLGGGYPELHAERLFVNLPVRRAIREFAEAGGPVYAECGGLMYLSRALVDSGNTRHRMVGVVAAESRLRDRVTLGYREVEALIDSPIARAGQTLRGHEFHFSVLDRPLAPAAYRRAGGEETEGVVTGPRGNVLASYIHVHFATDPRLAERFVDAAARNLR